jgi:hypothetical protein
MKVIIQLQVNNTNYEFTLKKMEQIQIIAK